MADSDPVLEKLRRICLALPNTKETMTWGSPHFRVGEKIFTGYGTEDDDARPDPKKVSGRHAPVESRKKALSSTEVKKRPSISAKVTLDEQAALIAADPNRFFVPPYVGSKGWVGIYMDGRLDWTMVEALVEKSFRNVAKVREVQALDSARGSQITAVPAKAPRAKKAAPRRKAAKKSARTPKGRR